MNAFAQNVMRVIAGRGKKSTAVAARPADSAAIAEAPPIEISPTGISSSTHLRSRRSRTRA
jgi:hypothetical protein